MIYDTTFKTILSEFGFNNPTFCELYSFFRSKNISFSVDATIKNVWSFNIYNPENSFYYISDDYENPDMCELDMFKYIAFEYDKITDLDHDWYYQLTDEQKESIERGLDDVKNGRVIPHEEVMKKIKEIMYIKPTVKILIGVPASGKSTYSTNFITENQNWVRINRDDYRFMLKNQPVCHYTIEKLITQLVNQALLASIDCGFNVILDNTNLKEKYIKDFIELIGDKANIEFKIFNITLDEAIYRDENREKKVGKEVIERMYEDYINLIKNYDFKI